MCVPQGAVRGYAPDMLALGHKMPVYAAVGRDANRGCRDSVSFKFKVVGVGLMNLSGLCFRSFYGQGGHNGILDCEFRLL